MTCVDVWTTQSWMPTYKPSRTKPSTGRRSRIPISSCASRCRSSWHARWSSTRSAVCGPRSVAVMSPTTWNSGSRMSGTPAPPT